jgi:toxin ParE1/3/4
MVRITWTTQAASDLISIGEYIERDSVRYARITINKIRSGTKYLKKYPLMGRIVPELGVEEIRELITGNYRIIYQVKNGIEIYILTVHHSARSLDKEKLSSAWK